MLQDFFADYHSAHTDYQVDNFIVETDGITLWGRYRQSLRELFGKISACRDMISHIRLMEINCAENEHKMKELRLTDHFEAKRLEVQNWDADLQLQVTRRKLQSRLKEMARWYAHCSYYREQITAIPSQKDLEEEYWVEKWKMEVSVRRVLGHQIPTDLMRHIMVLPEATRKDVMMHVHDIGECLLYVQTYEPIEVPDWYLNERIPESKEMERLCHEPELEWERVGTPDATNAPICELVQDSNKGCESNFILHRS